MTRAGRIMGAMMAMGAGLNSYERDGYARPRERYGMWCWRVAGVQSRPLLRIAAAKAKRARKAAKRRRDAELTRLGMALNRATIERDCTWDLWCRGVAPALNVAANARVNDAWKQWHEVYRGEVVP